MSWFGRLAYFKIQILPKILYIFQTFTIPVPSSHLSSLSHVLSTFLWSSKGARYAHHHLIKHRKVGGIDLPDLTDYLRALHFNFISGSNQNPDTLWVELEPSLDIMQSVSYPFSDPNLCHGMVSHTRLTGSRTLHALYSLPYISIRQWREMGIQWVEDLYQNGTLKDIEGLKCKD